MTRTEKRGSCQSLFPVLCAAGMVFVLSGCLPGGSKAARLERADAYCKKGDLEKAEIEYLGVLKSDARNFVAMSRLGIIFQMQGKWPRAILFLQQAKAAETNNADVRRALALTYLAVNERERAREEADFVLQRVPSDQDAIFVLVDAARNASEMTAMQERLQAMSGTVASGAAVHLGLGEIALKRGDLRSADSEIRKALEIEPASPVAQVALANLYFAQTNKAKAEEIFKSAAEAASARSFVKLKWADHLAQEGRLVESRQFLETNAKQAAGYVPPLLRLGQIALDQGRFEECEVVVARILAAEPLSLEGRLLGGKLKLAKGQGAKAVEDFERFFINWPLLNS